MTQPVAPGFIPRRQVDLADRILVIEKRIRDLQQNVAGATVASAGLRLSSSTPDPIGSASAGASPDASRGDHIHSSTLVAQQDVSAVSPAAGQGLIYTGSQWANVPLVVTSLAAVTAPYAGELVYNATDAMLYKYTAGAWVAVAALGPDSESSPSSTQLHEARYRASTGTSQAFATGNNAVQFASADYPSADVVVSGTGNTIFTLQRAGLWHIDFGARIADSTSGVNRTAQLTDSTLTGTVYKATSVPVSSGSPTVPLSTSCTIRFQSGTALSVNAISSSTGSIDAAAATNAAQTSISLTWLRP